MVQKHIQGKTVISAKPTAEATAQASTQRKAVKEKCICGKPSLFMCSNCRSITYCSREFQKPHWDAHALYCMKHPSSTTDPKKPTSSPSGHEVSDAKQPTSIVPPSSRQSSPLVSSFRSSRQAAPLPKDQTKYSFPYRQHPSGLPADRSSYNDLATQWDRWYRWSPLGRR
jgi:hypothetical protein